MKIYSVVFAVGVFLLCGTFQAIAKDQPLTVEEVNTLVTDRTMTVTEVVPDKKTGKIVTFKAYFSELGSIRALYPDGVSENYNWSVDKNGRLCVVNNARWQQMCGLVTSDNSNQFKFYRNKKRPNKVVVKNGRGVLTQDWKLVLHFSDIQNGQQLTSN